MNNILIQTKNLAKSFSNKMVLNEINLSAFEGRNLMIIGNSGEGKSVLLKCILGLIEPDFGQIIYKGKLLDSENRKHFFENVGILFQGSALFDSMPVWENVSFKYKYKGVLSNTERRNLASQKLELVGLPSNVSELYPAELSGGMQKRVGIARALAADPKLVLLDEPTSGLDPIMANVINKLIRKINEELGVTALTISHDLASVQMIADDIALLDSGVINWVGSLKEFKSTENLKIKKFIDPNSN